MKGGRVDTLRASVLLTTSEPEGWVAFLEMPPANPEQE